MALCSYLAVTASPSGITVVALTSSVPILPSSRYIPAVAIYMVITVIQLTSTVDRL